MKKEQLQSRKLIITAVRIRCAGQAANSTLKVWHYLRRQAAVGIVRLRTTATEFSFSF
jgi:hypothetical protein